jgi:hypothetical protein
LPHTRALVHGQYLILGRIYKIGFFHPDAKWEQKSKKGNKSLFAFFFAFIAFFVPTPPFALGPNFKNVF